MRHGINGIMAGLESVFELLPRADKVQNGAARFLSFLPGVQIAR